MCSQPDIRRKPVNPLTDRKENPLVSACFEHQCILWLLWPFKACAYSSEKSKRGNKASLMLCHAHNLVQGTKSCLAHHYSRQDEGACKTCLLRCCCRCVRSSSSQQLPLDDDLTHLQQQRNKHCLTCALILCTVVTNVAVAIVSNPCMYYLLGPTY